MGFTIKIVDNDTGNVLVEENEAKVIIGAIGMKDRVSCMGFVKASPIDTYHTIGGVQDVLTKISEEHPEFTILAQIDALMDKIEEKENKGKV